SQQPLSRRKPARRRSSSLWPPPQLSHGAGAQHLGAGGGGGHFGAGQGLQQSLCLNIPRNLSSSLGPLLPHVSQLVPQQALVVCATCTTVVSPAHQAVVTNKNAAFTRFPPRS